jgi:hypothetical protein
MSSSAIFATLLRDTVRTVLRHHDVHITDWHSARDVPLADGRFGLDEYTQHIVDFLAAMGPGAHLIAPGACARQVRALQALQSVYVEMIHGPAQHVGPKIELVGDFMYDFCLFTAGLGEERGSKGRRVGCLLSIVHGPKEQ